VAKVKQEKLSADAQCKGLVEVVVQDILLKANNVRFGKEKYYPASLDVSFYAYLHDRITGAAPGF